MKRKRQSGTPLLVKVLVVFFMAIGIFTVLRIQLKTNEIMEKTAQMEAEIAKNRETIASLEEELNAPLDREYLIRVARKRLGLCMPDEIIFYSDLNK